MHSHSGADLRPLLFSRAFASLADQLMLFAAPVIIYKTTESITLTGLAFTIEWLPRVCSLPIAGSLSDRFGSKRVYLVADGARSIFGLLALAVILTGSLPIFYVLMAYMGVSAFFYAQSYVALEALIPRVVESQELARTQSVVQSIEQAAMTTGPLIGALIFMVLESHWALAIACSLYGCAFLLMLNTHIPISINSAANTAKAISSIMTDMRYGLRLVWRTKSLRTITLLSLLINLIFGVVLATGALSVTGLFSQPEESFGVLQAVASAAIFVLLLWLPRLLKSTTIFHLGIFAYIAVALLAVSYVFMVNFFFYCFIYVAVLSIGSWFNIYIRTERALWIPKADLGKVIGVMVFLNQLTLPISGVIVSLHSTASSIPALISTLGALALFAFFTLINGLRSNSRVAAMPLAARS